MKLLKNDKDLQQSFLIGSSTLKKYVASTFGPKGRTVSLTTKNGKTLVTKDGVTVALFVESEDPFENVAIQILRQSAQKTCDEAGDGTTTTTILASAIYQSCLRYLELGYSAITIKESLERLSARCVEQIKKISFPVENESDIENIATVSANNDRETGKIVAEAVSQAGFYGSVLIEESKTNDTHLQILEGFRFDSGYLSDKFVTNKDRMSIFYENPFVYVTDYCFGASKQDVAPLEFAIRDNRPIVIVATDFDTEGSVIGACLNNFVQGKIKIALIKAPRFGEERRQILEDLCLSTGATFISKENNLTVADFKMDYFGKCGKFESTKYNTILGDCRGNPDNVLNRISGIKEQISQTTFMPEIEKLQERISRLSAGVCIIHVGGKTEAEVIEKKHRIEDSLGAIRAAQSYGILAGGTTAYIQLTKFLASDKDPLKNILIEAFKEPTLKIAENSGTNGELIYATLLKSKKGFNFKSGKYVDLIKDGIIEPSQVVISSLTNAVSAAMMLLMTSAAIVEQ